MTYGNVVKISDRKDWRRDDHLYVSFEVEGLDHSQLHFKVTGGTELVGCGHDAAATAILLPAMQRGGRLLIDGPLSEELLWSLNHRVVPLLRLAYPQLKPLHVDASDTRDERGGTAVLTGLSGGVDSLNVCLDHVVGSGAPPSLRVTHFTFNDISPEPSRGLLELRADRANDIAQRLGRPLIRISSDLAKFYRFPFQAVHTIQNASAALLLKGGARSWLYASGYPLSRASFEPTQDMASIDPILLPSLSTPDIGLHSVGGHLTRVAKTERLADWDIAHSYLNVCTRSVPNCGRCRKCLRTLLTLELLDAHSLFYRVFDMAAYSAVRSQFLLEVQSSDNFMLQEIAELIERRGLKDAWWRIGAFRSRRLIQRAVSRTATGKRVSKTVDLLRHRSR